MFLFRCLEKPASSLLIADIYQLQNLQLKCYFCFSSNDTMKFFFIRHIKYSTKNKNLCQIFLSISLVSLTFICAGNPPQRSSMIACVLVNVHSFLIGPPRYHNVLYFFCSKLYIFSVDTTAASTLSCGSLRKPFVKTATCTMFLFMLECCVLLINTLQFNRS